MFESISWFFSKKISDNYSCNIFIITFFEVAVIALTINILQKKKNTFKFNYIF